MDPTDLNLSDFTDSDKRELQTFLQNEGSKAKIQLTVHSLTDMCWKKCVTSKISSNKVDSGEESCMRNCVDRYVDSQLAVLRHLEKMRQGM